MSDQETLLRAVVHLRDRELVSLLFVAPDGDGEPTLWFPVDAATPSALFRRCDVGETGWGVVHALLIMARRGPVQARTIPSRRTDPDTSHGAAGRAIRAGTQRHRLLAAFALPAAADGLTDEEAADLADGVPFRSEFAKRCSELREAGWLEDTRIRRPGAAGYDRIVSRITDQGRAALAATPLPKTDTSR